MAVITDINALSTNQAMNGPDGSVDPPSTLDDQLRYHGAFIAQLRDGGGIPVGMCVPFIGGTSAPGWIKGNGVLLSRTTYAALFAYASSQGLVSEADWSANNWGRFSVGDGLTTFRAPDTRGMFVRGADESRGMDPGRVAGSFQDHANLAHVHGVNDPTHNHGDPGHSHAGSTSASGDHSHTYTAPQVSGVGSGTTGPFSKLVDGDVGRGTGAAGNHAHSISTDVRGAGLLGNSTGISIQSQGGAEGHPRNLAWPMYIKF
jgi:microcystin-dependent protein